jgi:phage gp16-like protein
MQRAPRKEQDNRQRLYTLLAVGKAELGWDDEFYYGIWLPMQGATLKDGRYSASTMDIGQLFQAVERMKDSGFKVKPAKSAGTRPQADDEQSRLIRSLWLQLHEAGKVRDPDERALVHWVRGQFKSSNGIEALQWLSVRQKRRIIEQLKQWLAR